MQALGQPARAAALLHLPFSPGAWALLPVPRAGRQTPAMEGFSSWSLVQEKDVGTAYAGRTWHIPLPPTHEPDLVPLVQADGWGWTEAVISGACSALAAHRGDQASGAGSSPLRPPPRLFATCVSVMDGADMLNYSGWMSSESL